MFQTPTNHTHLRMCTCLNPPMHLPNPCFLTPGAPFSFHSWRRFLLTSLLPWRTMHVMHRWRWMGELQAALVAVGAHQQPTGAHFCCLPTCLGSLTDRPTDGPVVLLVCVA